MENKLKILVLIRNFAKNHPKHRQKYDMIKAIEEFADVYYWGRNGSILDILKKINIKPDFILHYEDAWNNFFAPKITNLNKVGIPKGGFVIDTHWFPRRRKKYFNSSKLDLIFSVTKHPFLQKFPEYKSKFRWVPFSINPSIVKDWKLKKDIKFLLMGLVHYKGVKHPPKGRYPFREEVLKRMTSMDGFVFHKHPGHRAKPSPNLLVKELFSKQINRSEIFFTCGGVFRYPVMKYFEALGCKSLLLAEPNPDILELGFKDGENFVACSKENFYEKALYYSENKSEREIITENGYNFVQENHTNQIRAKEMIAYIKEFIEKKEG
ncbi:glycosyl transferase family 1 [Anaerobacillus alkalilacustris]|uniref:Glycosyl transferase family 1 n=1 Tax=Anaerobacillus alkalilacustris TaxID=393763 RepID=A0A1S2LD18_9BACI|nr:glycosyltransferase [Anaerobacillus alkalilacustris]OIJ10399.1 glycosyl transferase family 1 [Anaerobacillus alkalilacustris]